MSSRCRRCCEGGGASRDLHLSQIGTWSPPQRTEWWKSHQASQRAMSDGRTDIICLSSWRGFSRSSDWARFTRAEVVRSILGYDSMIVQHVLYRELWPDSGSVFVNG